MNGTSETQPTRTADKDDLVSRGPWSRSSSARTATVGSCGYGLTSRVEHRTPYPGVHLYNP